MYSKLVVENVIRFCSHKFYFSEQSNNENSEQADDLVPIRLDMEIEGHKLRDSFTWNRNEKNLRVEDFAKLLCDDLELPNTPFASAIAQSINTQLAEHPR